MEAFIANKRIKPAALIGALAASSALCLLYFHNRHKSRPEIDGKEHNPDDGAADTDHDKDDCGNSELQFYRDMGIVEENLPPHIRREIEKERRRKAKVEQISMKSPMYDNVFMLDKDRQPMCTISMKKARWYIRKGIAEWSSVPKYMEGNDNNGVAKCIRLLFEPSGGNYQTEGTPENLYLRSAKRNVCVACGNDGHHMRHYIVPYAYRTLLPDEYKTHMSHDIVILCPDCHVNCERLTKKRMKRMEEQLRTEEQDINAVIDDPHLHHVRSCAIALAKWKATMPKEKIDSHERIVREYLAEYCGMKNVLLTDEQTGNFASELTKKQLQAACSVNYRVKNPNYLSGSEIVIQSLGGERTKIQKFIIDWREYFIAIVNPKFMPTGWNVDNPVVCGRTDSTGDDSIRKW